MGTFGWILVVYVASIFVSRFMNYIAIRLSDRIPQMVPIWFIPFFNLVVGVVMIVDGVIQTTKFSFSNTKVYRWFNGEHWDKD
jgi:hypothetical protein